MRITIFAVVLVLLSAFEASAQQSLFAEQCAVPADTLVNCQVLCPTGREAIDGGGVQLFPTSGSSEFTGAFPVMSGLDFDPSPPSGIAIGWLAQHFAFQDEQMAVYVVCGPDLTEGTCRDADITNDGIQGSPDFIALSACFGKPQDTPLP